MKKYLKVSAIIALATVFLLMLFGCNSTDKIDKMYNTIVNADSMEIKISISYGELISFTKNTKMDENKVYSAAFLGEPEYYLEETNDVTYKYTKSLLTNKWTKAEYEEENGEDDITDSDEMKEIFNGDNYTYSKDLKAYVLNEGVTLDFEDMTIEKAEMTLGDNSCIVKTTSTYQGVNGTFEIKFLNIGTTEVTLPEVE